MVSADMCEHLWPGTGCPDCQAEREKMQLERTQEKIDMERKHVILGDAGGAETVMAQPAALVGGVSKKRATWFQAPNGKFRVVVGSEVVANDLETETEASAICKAYNDA